MVAVEPIFDPIAKREKIRHGLAARAEREFEHQRRQHQTNRVIDQKRGEYPRDGGDRDEKNQRPSGAARHPSVG